MIKNALIVLLALSLSFCKLYSTQSVIHAKTPAGYLPLKIDNNSKTLSNQDIYILIKGINPTTNSSCYVSIDSTTGIGTCVDTSGTTSSYSYSYPISSLLQTSDGCIIYLPQVISGRIYVSLAYPLDLLTDPASGVALDPDALNTSDPNYYILYDKVEFTYLASGSPAVDFNPTAVDFFSLPLYIQLKTNSGTQFSGFSQNRANIFSRIVAVFAQYDKTPNKIWSNLIIPFKDSTTQQEITPLRIASTGKAMTTAPALFDPNYLSNNAYGFNWIQNVWSTYYQSHSLSIDATELAAPNNQIFTGQVNSSNQFVFTAASGTPTVVINLPTNSSPFFSAAGDSFSASNDTPQAIIIRDLTSAFVTGLLPTSSANILGGAFFAQNKTRYYTNNPLLPSSASNTGPWYDLYSKALHSLKSKIYTFAYDDLLGISGTVSANMINSPSVTISLGDLTGTIIPNPFTDSILYDITVNFASINPVYYQGQLLQNNQTLTNISVPFSVELLGSDNQMHTANIYIKYPQVRPTFPGATGIIINQTGPSSATIVFPG